MHIQGSEFRFEGLNITVAYFSNEPDFEFDDKAPCWLGDDWPFDDTFNDFESFTFRKARGVLIVAVSDLTVDEMKLVNELVSESIDDHISLLICEEHKHYQAPQFHAVIYSSSNLVSSMYELAFAIYAASNKEDGLRELCGLVTVINQSRRGYLVRHWEDQKNKNRIDPCDLIEEWPMQADEGDCVMGLWTWLNPANYCWSIETKSNFAKFSETKLKSKSISLCESGNYEPVVNSRNPVPDVIQLIMI